MVPDVCHQISDRQVENDLIERESSDSLVLVFIAFLVISGSFLLLLICLHYSFKRNVHREMHKTMVKDVNDTLDKYYSMKASGSGTDAQKFEMSV